jgi:hypothetical protein
MPHKNPLLTRFFTLFIALLMAAVPTMQASAALVKCRTDPIFWLSNGDKLTVTLDINADAANIRNVTYVLHVPAGVTVTKVVYNGKKLGTEVYTVYQDGVTKIYKTDVLVTTQNTGTVAIVATAKLNPIYIGSASGQTGTYLTVSVSKP